MFDSHAHYDDKLYDEDREALFARLFSEERLSGILTIGCSERSSKEAIRLAETHDKVYAAVGFHPDHAEHVDIALLEELLKHPKVVAIGEIGLDYYYEDPGREIQQRALRLQLELAQKTGYPVIIHDRDAHGDILSIVKEYPGVKGVFHSYSGSVEMAKLLIDMGWYISFSGVVTFKNARQAPDVARMVPEDRFLTETDCPYLTPVPFRGKRNDSGKMYYTVEKLAELRGVPFQTVEEQSEENARRLFGIEI